MMMYKICKTPYYKIAKFTSSQSLCNIKRRISHQQKATDNNDTTKQRTSQFKFSKNKASIYRNPRLPSTFKSLARTACLVYSAPSKSK